MTLFKQIALLVTLMFLLLASIIIANDFKRTGVFLQGQLQTTAQDMATTLGIAISQSSAEADAPGLEVLFNSVFDSGYYSSIKLESVDGKLIHQKSQKIELADVPQWFVKMVPLQAAEGSTQVMKGWSQLGTLTLTLHPGYAYSGLYSALMSTLKWFAVIFLFAILLLWLMLKYILMPLQKVREQADSISRNQFVKQDKIPATQELKSVVVAMNRMVGKVQSVFDDQQATLSRYQQLLYKDKTTGLGNRRYMMDQLQQALAEQSSFHGCLAVIRLVNYEQLRDRHGYEVSDHILQQLSRLVGQSHAGLTAQTCARLNADEFALLIAADEDSVVDFLKHLYREASDVEDFEAVKDDTWLVAAVSALEAEQSLGDLLSGIDYCLSQAVSEGPYSIEQRVSNTLELPQGKMQWRHWLDDVLNSSRLFLVGQVALDNNQVAVQKELFIRTRNDKQQVIPASAFMPMASGLGMAIEIDKAVFKLINNSKTLGQEGVPLAINLSSAFFEQAEAHDEFDQLLSHSRDHDLKLCIEASHHILLQHPVMCAQISERVKKFGHQFGIDNLDPGQSLQLLQAAQFDYVKINALTLTELGFDEMASAFQALKTLTETLDIQIIAVAVDSQQIFDQLTTLGIKVMQGNFLNRPE
jgi:diguanylate cyclase (GGDEF)-like protein